MKPKFKARELWLFAPFLLIIAGAWYWQRVEQVSEPKPEGMYVSDFKLEAAPGARQEVGLSHRVTVTISHSSPMPKWWGAPYITLSGIDALQPSKIYPPSRGQTNAQELAIGEAITIVRDGKIKDLPIKYGANFLDFRFDGTNYISVNYLGLSEVPREWGAVKFHGLYRIAGNHQLVFEREVRKAGQTLPLVPDKSTGGRLIDVSVAPFEVSPCGPGSSAGCQMDEAGIDLQVRRTEPSTLPPEKQSISVGGEVEDEKGTIYRYNEPLGVSFAVGEAPAEATKGEAFPLENRILKVRLEKSIKTKGALKLHGKVWIDERWPIPFEIKLPPRPAATSPGK